MEGTAAGECAGPPAFSAAAVKLTILKYDRPETGAGEPEGERSHERITRSFSRWLPAQHLVNTIAARDAFVLHPDLAVGDEQTDVATVLRCGSWDGVLAHLADLKRGPDWMDPVAVLPLRPGDSIVARVRVDRQTALVLPTLSEGVRCP